MKFVDHPLGKFFQEQGLTIFFGSKNSKTDEYRKAFPNWKFLRLKQIHSAVIHHVDFNSPDLKLEGDAAIATETNLALCSISADCMPVFIIDPDKPVLAAIHAGWRGIAKRIIPATIEKMYGLGARPENLRIFIGPHILKNSFEVDQQVKTELMNSVKTEDPSFYEALVDQKFLIDLLALAEAQIREVAPAAKVSKLASDTKTDSQYHSFRRDREKSGRQVSFICVSKNLV